MTRNVHEKTENAIYKKEENERMWNERGNWRQRKIRGTKRKNEKDRLKNRNTRYFL